MNILCLLTGAVARPIWADKQRTTLVFFIPLKCKHICRWSNRRASFAGDISCKFHSFFFFKLGLNFYTLHSDTVFHKNPNDCAYCEVMPCVAGDVLNLMSGTVETSLFQY